jgi:hypothetical protein
VRSDSSPAISWFGLLLADTVIGIGLGPGHGADRGQKSGEQDRRQGDGESAAVGCPASHRNLLARARPNLLPYGGAWAAAPLQAQELADVDQPQQRPHRYGHRRGRWIWAWPAPGLQGGVDRPRQQIARAEAKSVVRVERGWSRPQRAGCVLGPSRTGRWQRPCPGLATGAQRAEVAPVTNPPRSAGYAWVVWSDLALLDARCAPPWGYVEQGD